MKILTKNIVFSVLKVGLLTAFLGAFMLVGVDLFKNLDTFTTYAVSSSEAIENCLLYAPEAFLLALGPSFLFAVTYYLSMLHASNEIICVLNAGVSYRKVIQPIILLAVSVMAFYFVFNETVALKTSNKKEAMMNVITKSENGANDNQQIALSDVNGGYMVYAGNYIDSKKALYDVTIVRTKENGQGIISRQNAYRATWNEETQQWTLHEVYTYFPSDEGTVSITYDKKAVSDFFKLEPELFKNLSSDVSKMRLSLANSYVGKMKVLNPTQYASLGTEYYKRLLGCLTPFIMIIIACSMNYRFKKNVLFFSIICSLCTAVVYYVIQMLTLMLADQGVIAPYMGMVIPFIAIIALTSLLTFFRKD